MEDIFWCQKIHKTTCSCFCAWKTVLRSQIPRKWAQKRTWKTFRSNSKIHWATYKAKTSTNFDSSISFRRIQRLSSICHRLVFFIMESKVIVNVTRHTNHFFFHVEKEKLIKSILNNRFKWSLAKLHCKWTSLNFESLTFLPEIVQS